MTSDLPSLQVLMKRLSVTNCVWVNSLIDDSVVNQSIILNRTDWGMMDMRGVR